MFLQLPIMPPKSHPPDVLPFLSRLERDDDNWKMTAVKSGGILPQTTAPTPAKMRLLCGSELPADNLGLCQHPTYILFDSNSFCKLHSQACSSYRQSSPGDYLSLTTHSRWKPFSQRISLLGTAPPGLGVSQTSLQSFWTLQQHWPFVLNVSHFSHSCVCI